MASPTKIAIVCRLSLLLPPLLCTLPGCGRSQPDAIEQRRLTDEAGRTATEYLQAVLARYRNAQSYRDQGSVRLSYHADDRLQSDQAPLRVWLDGSSFYLEAYDVRVWADGQTTTAWMIDPSTNDFDSQVLQVPSTPARPSLSALLADPILNDRLAAGLAGPPPQLDWLLADEPMQRLFAATHVIEFGADRELDGRLCATIHVNAEGDRYRFWIDKQSSLIRRVDLPPVNVPPVGANHVRLTLELAGATFDAPGDLPDMARLPRSPHWVSRFVPLPPEQPPAQLGSTPSAFRLRVPAQDFAISQRGSDRAATVLLLTNGRTASTGQVVNFTHWSHSLPAEIQAQIRVVVVADDANQQELSELNTGLAIDPDGAAHRAFQQVAGRSFDLAILDQQGRIVWLQSVIDANSLAPLVAIIQDVVQGIDVPARMRTQWHADVQQYRRLLDAETNRRRAAS